MSMTLRIRPLEDAPAFPESTGFAGAGALDSSSVEVVLRFAIEVSDAEELEALLHARRSMLREEWTRGRDSGEPSLQEAIFSRADISWPAQSSQRMWCLQKVEQLIDRAQRSLVPFPASVRA